MKKIFLFLITTILLAACSSPESKPQNPLPLTLELAQTTLSVDTDTASISGKIKNARGTVKLQYSLNQGQLNDIASAGQEFAFNVQGLQSGENTITVTAQDQENKTSAGTVKATYTPKQTFINATGTWSASLQNPCDASQVLEFWLKLQDTGSNSISGNFAVKMPSKVDILGILTGNKSKNTITGTLTYTNSSSNEYKMSISTELISGTNAEVSLAGDFLCGATKTAISANLAFAKNLEDDTFEPNDDYDYLYGSIPEIPFEQELNLMILPCDTDWFTFTLTEAKYVSFTFNKDLDFLLNFSSSEFTNPRTSNGTYTYSGFLEPKTYYFYVRSRDKVAYNLKVSELIAGDTKYERNEHWTIAGKITLPIQDKFYLDYGDIDWFTFTLSQDSLVSFNIFGPDQFSNADFRYGLYQNDLKLYGDVIGKHNFTLSQGTYHLKIHHTSDYGLRDFLYNININVIATDLPDVALEPNDIWEQATPVAIGERKEAFIYQFYNDIAWDDRGLEVDWFTFSLDKSQIVNIDLGSSSNQIDFALYEVSLSQPFRIDGFSSLTSINLKPGTYYLSTKLLSDSSVSTLTYPVQLTSQDVP